jgi:phospholipid/cholesterol/gamma-HCH transport system substrate-binding protein
MADETEALKHNFFFRGFFRKRGYFNLAHIPPDKYRKDPLFTSSANERVWLSADKLFQLNSNGLEELTVQGKNLLDGVVAQNGDSIVESPIMIEGYWIGDNSAEQLAHSRNRAILVRRHLQNHFQLDAAHLGIVPMKSLPPSGLDHSTWDGVCIVILKAKS